MTVSRGKVAAPPRRPDVKTLKIKRGEAKTACERDAPPFDSWNLQVESSLIFRL